MRAPLLRWTKLVSTGVALLAAGVLTALAASSCGGTSQTATGSSTERTTGSASRSTGGSTTEPTTGSTSQPTTDDDDSTSNAVYLGPDFGPPGPGPIEFGQVEVGASRSVTIAVINFEEVRTIVDTTIGGEAAAEFAVTGGTCAPALELDVRARCTVVVTFSPATSGTRTASLTVSTTPGAPANTRSLRGGFREPFTIPRPTVQTLTTKTS